MGFFDRFKRNKEPVKLNLPKRKTYRTTPVISLRNQLIQATANRLNAAWYRLELQSPNDLFANNIVNLRKLSRRMKDEDAITKSWYEALVTNVVGPHGIKFVPKIRRGKTSKTALNDTVNSELLKAWRQWEKTCYVTRKSDWVGVQEQAISAVCEDGEAFVNVLIDRNVNAAGVALEFLDSALLDHEYNQDVRMADGSVRKIRQGIELDSYDRAVAYHFWNRYPNSNTDRQKLKRIRIPALDLSKSGVQGGVIHLHYEVNDRANSLRGKPWLISVINWLARLNQYLDAELIAAVMASMMPGVITTDANDPTQYIEPTFTNVDREGTTVDANATLDLPKQPEYERIDYESGVLLKLAPGEKVEVPSFDRPNTAMETATRLYLHAIAAGMGISYSTLTSDTSEESYASGRLGVLQERDQWRRIQSWFARAFHWKVYEAWLRSALRTNLELPGSYAEYMEVEFSPRGWEWADQLRVIKSVVEQMKMGVVAPSQIAAQFGNDYEATVTQLAADFELMRSHGLDPDKIFSANTSTENPSPDGTKPAEEEA